MTTRQNLCTNPCAKNDVTGFGYASGGSTLTRVTGLTGYPRTTGARFASSGALNLAGGVASAGDVVTISFSALSETAADAAVDLYFISNGSSVGAAVSIPFAAANTVYRFEITRTVPSGTNVAVAGLIDLFNAGFTPLVVTGVLIEKAAAPAGSYFDGDTANAVWDGTNGSSTSTLTVGISQALPVAGETSAAVAFGRLKSRSLAVAAATSTAQTLGRTKTRVLPAAAETDTAQTLGGVLMAGGAPRRVATTPAGRTVDTTPAGRAA